MGVMLDTSAVIGWVERGDQSVIDAISGESQVPFVHAVTLGELEEGVVRAPKNSILRNRAATQGFATELACIDLSGSSRQPFIFGAVSAYIGRGPRHSSDRVPSACRSLNSRSGGPAGTHRRPRRRRDRRADRRGRLVLSGCRGQSAAFIEGQAAPSGPLTALDAVMPVDEAYGVYRRQDGHGGVPTVTRPTRNRRSQHSFLLDLDQAIAAANDVGVSLSTSKQPTDLYAWVTPHNEVLYFGKAAHGRRTKNESGWTKEFDCFALHIGFEPLIVRNNAKCVHLQRGCLDGDRIKKAYGSWREALQHWQPSEEVCRAVDELSIGARENPSGVWSESDFENFLIRLGVRAGYILANSQYATLWESKSVDARNVLAGIAVANSMALRVPIPPEASDA